jgi:Tfp pilus assembly protein PilO
MQMQKFKELVSNKQSVINISVAILAIVLYLCLFFVPKVKQIFSGLSVASGVRGQIIHTRKQWKDIDKLKKQAQQLQAKKDYYEKILPSEKEIPAILEYLSFAAKQLHVRISEIKPLEQKQGKKKNKSKITSAPLYYRVPILLQAECGYHALGRFIDRLESADRFMKISDIKIFARPNDAKRHKVQLLIVTYGMRE